MINFYCRALNKFLIFQVVNTCYGVRLEPNFKETIDQFADAYKELNINVTPKVHAVFHHVKEFCDLTNTGLGQWSEQTGEAVHFDFMHVWENYKRKSTSHPEYATRLYRAVCAYNGRHV